MDCRRLSWVDAVGDKSRFASGETNLYMGSIIYIVFIQISLHLVIRGIGSDFFFHQVKPGHNSTLNRLVFCEAGELTKIHVKSLI